MKTEVGLLLPLSIALLVASSMMTAAHAFSATSARIRPCQCSLKMIVSDLIDDDSNNSNSSIGKNKAPTSTLAGMNAAELLDSALSIDTNELMASIRKSNNGPAMSEAIPFLARPKVLTKELAGDFGFDPLNLAKDRNTLWYYREIEIKHARLAMLAAAGWPTSELLDRSIAHYFSIPAAVDEMGRAPSFLNGNMDHIRPEFWGFCLGLTAAIDSYQTVRSRTLGPDQYTPGDLGWDPLQCAATETSKKQMQLAEMQNGRLAMLGVTGFAVQEYDLSQSVVNETPFFFQPITESIEMVLKSIVE